MPLHEVKVPDIGDFESVAVIELLVAPGDAVRAEQSLITVESDKASMEIPSPTAGVVKELKVALGDKVSEGSTIALLETAEVPATQAPPLAEAAAPVVPAGEAPVPAPVPAAAAPAQDAATAPKTAEPVPAPPTAARESPTGPHPVASVAPAPATEPVPPHDPAGTVPSAALPHASPSIRRQARELGVPLAEIAGSGPKGRITADDLQRFVKDVMAGRRQTAAQQARMPAAGGGIAFAGLPAWPQLDFAKFGPIERQPLSRIRKISGPALHRNWVSIPHVTQHDEADVTTLEAFRVAVNEEQAKTGSPTRLTMLAFVVKACIAALQEFPEFNSSLDGDALVLKRYYHIGFAADTPNGLVVPVLRDADRKGALSLAAETAALAAKAREGKLTPAEMSGGTFSISSLGGIGGIAFTPIINAPEVAILGVSRHAMRPRWDGKQFVPRLMLPLSLSYDHRVIDGASAARFCSYLAQVLADFRRVLL